MKIYFVLHSTTTDNEAKIASGWKDVELSKLGIRQAREIGERFKDIKINLIYCSDLKRAVDTAKIAFGNKLPIITDERLRQLNYGNFNGKLSSVVESMKKEHINKPFPCGESYKKATERIQDFCKDLKEKYPDKTILIVGHQTTQYGLDILVDGKVIEKCLNTPFKWQPYWEYNL